MRNSRRIRIGNNISLGTLLGISFFMSLAIGYVYASSIYYAYVFLSIAIMSFTYINFMMKMHQINNICRSIIITLLFVSLLSAIVHGDIKSNLMLNTSLILPATISTLDIKISNEKRALMWCCIVALISVIAQVKMNVFGYINSNSFSFLAYMGISIAFVWFKVAKRKILPILYLSVSYYYILQTGSRNVAIVIILCFILLIIPQRLWKNPWVYRCVYLSALIYTVFAIYIMDFGFANTDISNLLDRYVQSFSEKAWDMSSRVDYLVLIQSRLSNKSFLEQLLGSGIAKHHGHNLFFQSVFVYGYLGTVLVYALYIIVLEMAYKVIKNEDNMTVLGCVIIMIGHFLIQGADVYMLGVEGCLIMPLVIMGVIMQQYKQMLKKETGETTRCQSV